MTLKYREGSPVVTALTEDLAAHLAANAAALSEHGRFLREGQVQAAIERLSDVVVRSNALVDSSAPWKLAKDPEQAARLDAVLATLILSARTAATMLLPVLPEASEEILRQLNLTAASAGDAGTLPADYRCGEPKPVFPRLEMPVAEA